MFDQKLVNLSVYAKSAAVNVRQLPGTDKPVVARFTKQIGRTSGFYTEKSDGNWYQVSINNPDNPLATTGYVRFDVVTFAEPAKTNNTQATNNAKAMMDKLVEQEKEIYKTIIKLAPVIKQLESKGVNIQPEKVVYKSLVNRLASRNQKFITTNLVKVTKGQLTGYENEMKDFEDVWAKIGIAPLVAGIIIGAAFALTAGAAVYYAFKPNYEESKVDFTLSKDLDAVCRAKLTPAEYEQLKKEGKEQIDKSYNAGKNAESMSMLTKVLFFVGGFFVVDKFILSPKKGK